jgi:hypothetical protein
MVSYTVATDLKTATLDGALLREGVITRVQLEEAQEERYETEKSLSAVLVDMGAVSETALLEFLRARMGFDIVSLKGTTIEPAVYEQVPSAFARHKRVVPVRFEYDALVLAMEDPTDFHLIDDLRQRLGVRIHPVAASMADISAALAAYPKDLLTGAGAGAKPLWFRFLQVAFFPMMLVAPIAAILGLALQGYVPRLRNLANEYIIRSYYQNKYDFIIKFMVLYGIWCVVMWLINGIFLPKEETPTEEE